MTTDPTTPTKDEVEAMIRKVRALTTAAQKYLDYISRGTMERGKYVTIVDPGGYYPPLQHALTKAIGEAEESAAMLQSLSDREKAKPVEGAWIDGAPGKPWSDELFIAQTTFGEKVALIALPEEFVYDFKTADDTYLKRDVIKCWMQFPDTQYVSPLTAQLSTAIQERDAARERALEEAAKVADTFAEESVLGDENTEAVNAALLHRIDTAQRVAFELRALKSQSPAAQDGVTEAAQFKVESNGPPCPTCGFKIRKSVRPPFTFKDD